MTRWATSKLWHLKYMFELIDASHWMDIYTHRVQTVHGRSTQSLRKRIPRPCLNCYADFYLHLVFVLNEIVATVAAFLLEWAGGPAVPQATSTGNEMVFKLLFNKG